VHTAFGDRWLRSPSWRCRSPSEMPNTARLTPTPFLPLSRVPRYLVSAGEEEGRGWLNGLPGFALLVLFCLTLYIPGLTSIPPVDRDEARFAQATPADAGNPAISSKSAFSTKRATKSLSVFIGCRRSKDPWSREGSILSRYTV